MSTMQPPRGWASAIQATGDDDPCLKLWRDVVATAWQDALGIPGADEDARIGHTKTMARRWFERADCDFRDVCFWAGLDPDAVQDRYRRAVEARIGATEAQLASGRRPTTQETRKAAVRQEIGKVA